MVKLFLNGLMMLLLICYGCLNKKDSAHQQNENRMISKNMAITISKEDASVAYGDLSIYSIEARLEKDNWIIDYLLKDKNSVGGGPHYVISAKDGKIINYKYDQ